MSKRGSPAKAAAASRAAYVGDLLVSVRLVPERAAPRLVYRWPFRMAAQALQLPPQLLLPEWLRGRLIGAIAWFVDGLLTASQALRILPASPAAAQALRGPGARDEGEEMAGVPKLNLFSKLFYLTTLTMTLASVSLGGSVALVVLAGLFPVVTLMVATSLLAVVGFGLPAILVIAFIISAPPVRRRLLEPAILRFGWSRLLFFEEAAGAGKTTIGAEEQEGE